MVRLAYPIYLLLLLVIPYILWRYRRHGWVLGPLVYSDVRRITRAFGIADNALHRTPPRHRARALLVGLRVMTIALVVVALARPQAELITEEILTHGVDILLVVDVSGSMGLIDQPFGGERDRLDITKEVVSNFVAGRENDRIGSVVYAGEAYTQTPLTVDYGILTTFFEKTTTQDIQEQGTAIGVAIATGLSRLRHSEAKSKVMVLITDGRNNTGEIMPVDAAKMAKTLGIKIYAIGVGSNGPIYMRRQGPFGVTHERVSGEELDEKTLRAIADTTDGQFFRAMDRASLEKTFDEINEMEKSEIETQGHRRFRELFMLLLLPALGLFLLEVLLSKTRLRKLP